MRKLTKRTPDQRAAKYLKRIAALTGAQKVDNGYLLTVGRSQLLLEHKFLNVTSNPENSTCFYVPTNARLPEAEVIASALLQLKNNPKLVKKWRNWRGYIFKANGKMFRGPSGITHAGKRLDGHDGISKNGFAWPLRPLPATQYVSLMASSRMRRESFRCVPTRQNTYIANC